MKKMVCRQRALFCALITLLLIADEASSFSMPSRDTSAFPTKSAVSTVAVTGATGRTGQLVVQELLDRGVSQVLALVRDENKAAQIFSDKPPSNLQIVKCDLTSEAQISQALQSADAAIWCATGFSNNPEADPLTKVKRLLGIALKPKSSVDAVGLPAMTQALANANGSSGDGLPKVVLCSSAGVTRSTWDDAKKERLAGSADIPIVRLNPFGILDVKRESEEKLRQTCDNYCIVRPTGLNDNHPAGSRPIVSQGDVAVGRINRQDVAKVLVDVLSIPEATGKTFEVFTVQGYPPSTSLRPALSRLVSDHQGPVLEERVEATYHALQQLLPGQEQDSAGLAMGQTYEQYDEGETGRLGKRGQENVENAGLVPSTK